MMETDSNERFPENRKTQTFSNCIAGKTRKAWVLVTSVLRFGSYFSN